MPIWPDRISDTEALGGIYTAVFHSAFSQTFCIAYDMPFPNRAVITYLRDLALGYDAVVPQTSDGYQPPLAVYSKTGLRYMEAMIHADRLKFDRLFPVVRVRTVAQEEPRSMEPSLFCFVNVDTGEALEAATRLTGRIE